MTDTNRRQLLASLAIAAAPLGTALAAAHVGGGLSPRLAALKEEFDAAAGEERRLHALLPEVFENDWLTPMDLLNEIARDIVAEPVATAADMLLKLDVVDRTVLIDDSEPDEESSGWMDRAQYRLLRDMRQLLREG